MGYKIISGFVTKNQFPLGRLEKEFVTPELISPKRLIIEQELEKMLEQLKKDLIGKNIPYRENGKVVVGNEKIPWDDYQKRMVGY